MKISRRAVMAGVARAASADALTAATAGVSKTGEQESAMAKGQPAGIYGKGSMTF